MTERAERTAPEELTNAMKRRELYLIQGEIPTDPASKRMKEAFPRQAIEKVPRAAR